MANEVKGPSLDRRQLLKRSGLSAAVLLGGPSLLAACSSAEPGTESSGGDPVKGGTLVLGMISGGQAESLNPAIATVFADITRTQQIWEGLFQLTDTGNPEPWLLETAEPNRDASEWTLRLKAGITWHDGTPLTADDLMYNIQQWADPFHAFAGVTQSVVDVASAKKMDDLTVRLPLMIPYADFPAFTAQYYGYLVPKGAQDFKNIQNPIGTGPFKVDSFTPGSRSEFSAYADYWAGAPYLDGVIVDSSFSDENARTNALLSGAVDVVPQMSFALAKTLEGQQSVRVASAHTPQPYYLPARVDQAPFKDPRVMQALKLVVDQQQIIDSAYNGYGQVTPHLPLKGLKHFLEDAPVPEQDIDQAKSLLKAAGYENLQFELVTADVLPGIPETSTLFSSQAKQAGIDVRVKKLDPTTYYTMPAAGGQWLEYPIMTTSSGGGASIPSLPHFYLSNLGYKGFPNETHFGSPETQAMTLDAVAEQDETKAQEKWAAVQQIQLEQGGYILAGTVDAVDGFRTTVHGCDPTAGGTLNNNDLRKVWKDA